VARRATASGPVRAGPGDTRGRAPGSTTRGRERPAALRPSHRGISRPQFRGTGADRQCASFERGITMRRLSHKAPHDDREREPGPDLVDDEGKDHPGEDFDNVWA